MTNPSTNADDRTPGSDDERGNAADENPDDQPAVDRSAGRSPVDGPADQSCPDLAAVVVERDVGPDQCTIYPEGASDDDLVTKWITAEEGSYVDVESMR